MRPVAWLPIVTVLALPLMTHADEASTPDRGVGVATLAVPGMECEGTCPALVKAALEGDGVDEVRVDFKTRTAVLLFAPEKTTAREALLRLTKLKPFAASTLASLEATFEGDFLKARATSDVKPKKARVHVTLEPRRGHTLNTAAGAPDLEVELVLLPAGYKAKEGLVKVKGGLKATRVFDFELELPARARPGEVSVTVEVRAEDVSGGAKTKRQLDLAVPVTVP
jgi:copper chaperone CopZ